MFDCDIDLSIFFKSYIENLIVDEALRGLTLEIHISEIPFA